MSEQWKDAFRLAILNDLMDLTPIGEAPILGDFLDALTTALSAHVAPDYAKTNAFLLQLAELLPGLDFLPMHTIAVVEAYAEEKNITPREAFKELAQTTDILPLRLTNLLK